MYSVAYLFSKLIKKIHIASVKDCHLDKTSKICSFSNVIGSKIGRYSYIGSFCSIINSEIGSFCSIADNVIIGGAMHPITWVSTSPVFCKGRNILRKNFANHDFNPSCRTLIGNDVWIGNNVIIKQGVSIGDGAIIGMGAIVTKNVKPYSIVAGNPATIIGMRFSDDIINDIIKIKWYNFPESKLQEQAYLFNDINSFININNE